MKVSDFALYILPIVVFAATIEGWVLNRRRGHYDWRAYGLSLVDLAGRAVMNYVPIALATPFLFFAYEHRLFEIPNAAWAVVLLVLGQEFCYYWLHRMSHEVRYFWCSHVVHHSPNELNLSAAYRLGWTARASGVGIFYLPLAFLGFHPLAIAAVHTINLLYQFWLHADWIPKLGPLEWGLNTPSHHRVHHARNPEYLDKNYGGVLIIWDRLFGTFAEEKSDRPCDYGLTDRITSYNPLVLEFREWARMVRDIASARGWRERVRFVLGRPGWRPARPATAQRAGSPIRGAAGP